MNPFYMMYPMMIPNIPDEKFFRPPLLFDLLNSKINFGSEVQTSIKDLCRTASPIVFDFAYPLSIKVNKEQFETMILQKFLMRRIGYETYLAWKLALEVKMNEIMPYYNKLFDSFEDWNLFEDGETTTRTGRDDTAGNSTGSTATQSAGTTTTQNASATSATSDRRYSNLPQNQLSDVRDGKYITDYNYDQNSATDNSSSNGTNNVSTNVSETNSNSEQKLYSETIEKDAGNKIEIFEKYLENKNKIMTMIYKDLDTLFYGLV